MAVVCQVAVAKYSFLLCLGISVFVCSLIYIRTRIDTDHYTGTMQWQTSSCRDFSDQCRIFLPETHKGTEFYRRDCQVENYILHQFQNCSNLIKVLHFITRPLSHEEEDFPLAFIVTIHKDLEVFVRLLRAIYMPQNVYCIHVDAKAPLEYQAAVQRLANCFNNVFLSSRSENVTYAGFSRLQADLNCMKDLSKSNVAWKKVVNLCGQDFPVKSNKELVQMLQSKFWKDKNMTPGIKQPTYMHYRTELQYQEIVGSKIVQKGPKHRKGPPPHNLQIYFGTAYYALTRAFVDFVLESPIAQELLEWSKDTFSPDEHYWVTLNHLQEAPGSRIDGGWEGEIRSIKWRDQEGKAHDGCKGNYVRNICVYGVEDVPWIIKKNSMFANKFAGNTFPEALDCLEQWHRNKVLNQTTVPIESSWLLATQRKSNHSSFYNSSSVRA